MYKSFVNTHRSIIIAPAGYGKTYTIAKSLNFTEGKQLILTHTNAGVASIKNKLQELKVNSQYRVETISGFAQKFVHAFIPKLKIPEQDSPDYFPYVISEAIRLFNLLLIKRIIKANYNGLFVDEYQDCTVSQHVLIEALAELLPAHILGDPLQGIFNFNDEDLIDFQSDLSKYSITGKLEIPWRWRNTNIELGNDLKSIREKLEKSENIDLSELPNIEKYQVAEIELYTRDTDYRNKLWKIINQEEDLLVIYPQSHNIQGRLKVIKSFSNTINLIEAMDGSEFYNTSRSIDAANSDTIYHTIHSIAELLFNKTAVNNWFGPNALKNKRLEKDKRIIHSVKTAIEDLQKNISYVAVADILNLVSRLPNIKCYRIELYRDICTACTDASLNKQTVYDSMSKIRNSKRHIGKSIRGRNIGTTLLTKGLEFETVVILNAQQFSCPKNFYVAVTRASRRLVVFSDNLKLNFSN